MAAETMQAMVRRTMQSGACPRCSWTDGDRRGFDRLTPMDACRTDGLAFGRPNLMCERSDDHVYS